VTDRVPSDVDPVVLAWLAAFAAELGVAPATDGEIDDLLALAGRPPTPPPARPRPSPAGWRPGPACRLTRRGPPPSGCATAGPSARTGRSFGTNSARTRMKVPARGKKSPMRLLAGWCESLVSLWSRFDDDPPLLCGCEDGDCPCDDAPARLLQPLV